jgi:hypothetical protein
MEKLLNDPITGNANRATLVIAELILIVLIVNTIIINAF